MGEAPWIWNQKALRVTGCLSASWASPKDTAADLASFMASSARLGKSVGLSVKRTRAPRVSNGENLSDPVSTSIRHVYRYDLDLIQFAPGDGEIV